jgi:dCMP deaminase
MGMHRISKDDYYLDIALAVSKRSTCLKRHYGCVIVKNDEIIATGYNGSPRGYDNCCDIGFCKRLDKEHNSGDYSDCHSVHAEQNAMLSASRKDMIGSTMYLAGEELYDRGENCLHNRYMHLPIKEKCEPCPICSRMLANSGVEKVISNKGIVWERSV